MGINPKHFSFEMKPGEAFWAPEAVLAYSDQGFSGLTICIMISTGKISAALLMGNGPGRY